MKDTRTPEQRFLADKKFRKDTLQPYNREGKPNKEFKKTYGDSWYKNEGYKTTAVAKNHN